MMRNNIVDTYLREVLGADAEKGGGCGAAAAAAASTIYVAASILSGMIS